MQKFSQLSRRSKAAWVLGVIIIFSLAIFMLVGGGYYNQLTDRISQGTNGVVSLPKVTDRPFNLGLDLQGGSHLVYEADVSGIAEGDRASALEAARDVIEKRVNFLS